MSEYTPSCEADVVGWLLIARCYNDRWHTYAKYGRTVKHAEYA